MAVASRLSIPRRVFLGFALVLSVSGLVSVASVVQHARTANTLRLLREGYLPLSLSISELRATQSVFGNLLDRVLTERGQGATRAWLNVGRKARPDMLNKTLSGISNLEAMAPSAADRQTLASLRREVRRVRTMLRLGEARYDELYALLDAGDRSAAERVLADLRVRERGIDSRLRTARDTVLARIDATSASAAEQQRQAIAVLLVLALVALVVGVGVTIWSQRMLSPLPLLQTRVEAVARGELDGHTDLGAGGDDEISRLAREFERMVGALSARDQSLREASESLQVLQRLQAQILADLSAAVLVVDEQGLLLSRNPAAGRLLGLSTEAVGKPIVGLAVASTLPDLVRAIDTVAAGSGAQSLSELTLRRNPFDSVPPVTATTLAQPAQPKAPAGAGPQDRLINVVVTPFGSDGSGARRQVLVVVEDVTDAVRTKARLIQTERLAAIGRMAAHVTHEVRNPLSSIGLNVELLEEELADADAEPRDLLRAIHQEIDRLRNITEEYLRVARVPTPRLLPEAIEDLTRGTADFLRHELSAARVALSLDIPETLPPVALDEAQFRQVLINLMKNAREAMPEGGRLDVSLREARDGVVVRVTDDGPGMARAEREHIFDLFYTTKTMGTGLGLPLTQQIVLAHGGQIDCRSAPDEGTTFEVWFPAWHQEDANANESAHGERTKAQVQPASPRAQGAVPGPQQELGNS